MSTEARAESGRLPAARVPELSSRACIALVVFAVASVALVRLHRLDVPLERDEGEFAYVAQLILDGETPFVAAYNMKLPGIYYAYAAILALGGEQGAAVRLGHLAVNALAIVLVFLLGRRLVGETAAALAAVAYAALALLPPVLGLFAHATHFVVAAALAGLWLLERERAEAPRSGALFAAGLALGLGVTMKQHGVAFAAFGLAVLWARLRAAGASRATWLRSLGSLAAGGLLPLALIVSSLFRGGALESFWFWTVEYGARYAALTPPGEGLVNLLATALPLVLGGGVLLWGLAVVGAVALAGGRVEGKRAYLLGLLAASGLATAPGLYFRPHYFVLLLPAVSLLAGTGVLVAARRLAPGRGGTAAVGLLALALAVVGLAYGRSLVSFDADRVSHATYGDEFFPEMRDLALELRRRSAPGDRVAVLGSEPEIYFYADRRAATGFLYVYPMMESQPAARSMQEQMVGEIEASPPRFVVYVHAPHSWGREADSDPFLLDWLRGFLDRYRRVGLVELRPGGRSSAIWRPGAGSRRPRAPAWAAIYERNEGGAQGG